MDICGGVMPSGTLWGFANSKICVTAAGDRMGLKAGSSVLEGGSNFTLMT